MNAHGNAQDSYDRNNEIKITYLTPAKLIKNIKNYFGEAASKTKYVYLYFDQVKINNYGCSTNIKKIVAVNDKHIMIQKSFLANHKFNLPNKQTESSLLKPLIEGDRVMLKVIIEVEKNQLVKQAQLGAAQVQTYEYHKTIIERPQAKELELVQLARHDLVGVQLVQPLRYERVDEQSNERSELTHTSQ